MNRFIIILLASVLTTQVYANGTGFFQEYNMKCQRHKLTQHKPAQFDEIENCKSGIIWVKKDGKYGFVDDAGEMIVPLMYEQATRFSGVGFVKQGLTWIAFDKDGNQVYTIITDEVRQAFNGYAKLINHTEQGKKVGLIESSTGKILIPAKYDDLDQVVDGAIGFAQNNQYGFLNLNGKVIVKPIYDGVGIFKQGKAVVYKDGKSGVVNKKGKLIVPFTLQRIFIGQEGEVIYRD